VTLSEIVARFRGLRIAVIGDAMVDVYHWGRVTKMSQEAPVPVFVEDRIERRPGGAANVGENLKALGANVTVHSSPYATTEKHRYLAGHYQLFRVDNDHLWTPTEEHVEALVQGLEEMDSLDAIILSDYAKGTCRARVCAAAITEARLRRIPCVVDPKGSSWTKYDGATVICPNEVEYAALRTSAPDVDILEKRGPEGIQLHYSGSRLGPLIPARVRHVYDTTGAGDTVVAVVAAALAAGGSLEQAAELGCIAAGYVVAEVGTATCPLSYLEEECELSSAMDASTVSTMVTEGSSSGASVWVTTSSSQSIPIIRSASSKAEGDRETR
jgi:D-beta-D-heptose 7-phosphate kinase/D-beta-D-heptose 1-phosphate adenosyltransferase